MKFTLDKERQEAERKRIEARGTADAQKIISQALNQQFLRLKEIEAMEKLAGSNNAKVVIMGGGTGEAPVMFQLDSTQSP